MKKTKLFFLTILVCLIFTNTNIYAQATGDFGSNATGNWGTDGTNWVVCVTPGQWTDATSAANAPTATDNVWIRAGHTVTAEATGKTCKNLTIEGTATLISTSASGTNNVMLSGTTLTLMANSTYKLAGTASYMGIAWANVSVDDKSTIEINGTQSSLPLSTSTNGPITFGNLNWYAGTCALTATTNYVQLIVKGNLTIGSSNTSTSKIRGATSSFPNSLTHTVYGDVIINGAASTMGLSLANSTAAGANITFDVKGNVYLKAGKISMEESGGSPISTLKVGGNLTIGDGGSVAAMLQLASNSTQAGTSAVNIIGNVLVASNGSIAKNSGTTGCSLAINMNGTNPQTWTGAFPAAFATGILCGVNINNTAGVTLNNAITVNPFITLTVNTGAILKSGYTLTNSNVTNINGSFQIEEGGWATGTNFVYGAAGTLVFNNTSGFYAVSGTPVFWPTANGPANVTVQNTGGLELQIPRTVSGLFQTSTGVKNTFGNDLTVSGTVRLNSGGYFGNFSPTYTSTGTLEYNTGGSYGVYNEWGAGSGVGYGVPQNVSVLNATAVNLSGARSIPGTLTLTSGKLSLGANDLTIGTAISGGSATSYIVTDGAGKVTAPATAAVATLIPVGASASSYDPVNVTPTTTTTFAVKAYSTLSGTAPYGVRFNTKEWDLTPALASSTLIALTPSNLVESVSSPVIGHYVSGSYVNSSATMTNSNTTYTGTFNTFSPFVTGANVDVTGITERIENTVNAFTEANHLIVTGTLAGDIILVYGLNGQTVANVKANANQTVINMNKGLYLVNVKSSDKTTNFKFVLK